MPFSVVVHIPGERIPDGYGGYTTGPGTTVQTKGRLRGMSGSEQMVAQRMSESVEGVLDIPVDVEVKSTYSLEVEGVGYAIKHVGLGTYRAQQSLMVARV